MDSPIINVNNPGIEICSRDNDLSQNTIHDSGNNEYVDNMDYNDEQEIMYNIEKMEKIDELKKMYAVKELDRIIELKEKTSK